MVAHKAINNATATAFCENSALSAHPPYLHGAVKKKCFNLLPSAPSSLTHITKKGGRGKRRNHLQRE